MQDFGKLLGIELSERQLAQFETYYEMLVEWNERMNLTAITEKDEVTVKHFEDSLLLSRYKNLREGGEVIDVGTGAGFPGIPLKIAFPKLSVTLLDSLNKRVGFLQAVISELGLSDIRAIHARAEDAGQSASHREKYDLAVSRAVANLSVLSEFCIPFVRPGGYFVAYKAGRSDELPDGKKAIRLLGGQVENIFRTTLPSTEIERTFVFVKKMELTPAGYPRRAGMATKKPLGKNIKP